MEDGWVAFAAFGVSMLALLAYVLMMIFLPEWVGITGKKALEAERSHEGGAPSGPDLIDELQSHSRPVKNEKEKT
jgi:hypothetical protein